MRTHQRVGRSSASVDGEAVRVRARVRTTAVTDLGAAVRHHSSVVWLSLDTASKQAGRSAGHRCQDYLSARAPAPAATINLTHPHPTPPHHGRLTATA